MAHKRSHHGHHGHHPMHHLAEEHSRHGHRLHHEAEMHSKMGGGHAHGQYMNEEERPKVAPAGHLDHAMGCSDFKGEAMDIAYGQAGMKGCKSDGSKIVSQFKDYHWAGASGDY